MANGRMIDRNVALSRWVYRHFENRQNVFEWRITNRNREGFEWDVSKWKTVMDKPVENEELHK